jgi:exopolysaccharide biosynthesis polyprenyl glycosylphosphotransferase
VGVAAQEAREIIALPSAVAAELDSLPVPRSRVLGRYRRLAWAIGATDVLALVVAMLLSYGIRFGFDSHISMDFAVLMVSGPILWVGVFLSFRLYGIQHYSPSEEFRRIFAAVSLAVTAIAVASFWSKASYSREWVGLTWLSATFLVLAARQSWHQTMSRMRADGRLTYATLVVGTNDEAARLAQSMRTTPDLGYRPLGCIRTGKDPVRTLHLDEQMVAGGIQVLGATATIREAIRRTGADCLFIASSALSPQETAKVARAARLEGIEMRISANLPEMLAGRLSVQPFADTMAVALRPVRLTGGQVVLKRTFDLVVATFGLLALLPLTLSIAAAIKLTSKGPVFFRQVRVGKHGGLFTLLKFRTMIDGAEALVSDLQDRNEADGPLFKIREDPRVTRIGRWLRKWSFDELPQLWNVVRGRMSLVGPRPAVPDEVAEYDDWHHGRLEVAPGMTGLWQVSGRSDLSFDDYVRRDLFYIENWSVTYDLYILLKTVPALVSRNGAY